MSTETFEETPLVVAVRILGSTAALLVAMLLIVHPQAMGDTMSSMMSMIH